MLLFGAIFGTIGIIISIIVGTIMLALSAFIMSFGWISTIFVNDLVVNFSVVGFAIIAFDIIGAPIVGTWVLIYCFAGISGYDGKGCSSGISGLIPSSSSS